MKGVLVLFLLIGNVNAAYLNQVWEYSTRESNEHAFFLNLNSDPALEVVTDAPRSGLVFGLSSSGSELWRFRGRGYVFDVHAKEFPFGSKIVLGAYGNARCINGDGSECWNYLATRSKIVTTYVDDLDNDHKGEAVLGVVGNWRGNSVSVIKDGKTTAKYSLGRTVYPNVLHATNIDADAAKEIIVGTAGYSVNTLAENFEVSFRKDAEVRAYDEDLVWSFGTTGGVRAIISGNIDGNAMEEIIVGSNNFIYVLDNNGKLRWSYPIRTNSLAIADIDGDGTPEVLAGSSMLYAFQNNGTVLWKTGNIGTINAIATKDMDGDGKAEIFAGSGKLYIFNHEGTAIWSSESYKTVNSIDIADMDNDNFNEVVISSGYGKVKVFESKTHVLGLMADNLYTEAKGLYNGGQYQNASIIAKEASEMFEELGNGNKVLNTKELSDNSIDHMTADNQSRLAIEYYKVKDFGNATKYANTALEIYRRLRDNNGIKNMSQIIGYSISRPIAQDNYSVALSYYNDRNFDNALEPARRSLAQFTGMGDENETEKAKTLLSKIEKQLDATELYNLAVGSYIREDYETATSQLDSARVIYTEQGDQEGLAQVEELIEDIRGVKTWKNALLYGSMGFIAIIIVGALMVVITMAIVARTYSKKKTKRVIKKRVGTKNLRDI